MGVAQNTYKAIHYFLENQESIVCIIDADNAIIGKNALKNLFEKYSYFGADVVIAKCTEPTKFTHIINTHRILLIHDYMLEMYGNTFGVLKNIFLTVEF